MPVVRSLLPGSVDRWVRNMVEHVIAQRHRSAERRNDFLQTLIETRDKSQSSADYDANTLPGHSLSFLTEGYETSSTTMAFCLYDLARNPAVQRRVQAEVDEAFRTQGDGRLTDDVLQRLSYLETVVYETLRVHSIVFAMSRVCTKDFELPPQFADGKAGVTIPKGTPVILPIYSLHK